MAAPAPAATTTPTGATNQIGTIQAWCSTRKTASPAMPEVAPASIDPVRLAARFMRLPLFDGARSMEERLSRVIRAGGVFMEQARRRYRMWLREPMLTAAWIETGAEYGARWDELMRTALGPLADDEEAMAVLRAVIHPEFFDALRARKRSTDEASALATAVVGPWFAARARRHE